MFLLQSCSSWFDVDPQTEIKEEEIFATENGFYEALMGIYIKSTETGLYGKELCYGFIELLANQYTPSGASTTYPNTVAALDFEDASVYNKAISFWGQLYFLIANCNNLLTNLEETAVAFPEHNREMLEAEAKALRAFYHFDLLRMYAPSPLGENGLQANAIPYVDMMTTIPFPQLTIEQVIEKIMKDLKDARDLLADHDPVFFGEESSGTSGILGYLEGNGFRYGRKVRMNYWAVTGLLAKVALYAGDKVAAYNYAKEVYESDYALFSELAQYTWYGSGLISAFWINNNQNINNTKSVFSEDASTRWNLSTTNRNTLYENDKYPSNDIRNVKDWSIREEESTEFPGKFSSGQYCKPIMKRSEICLILAETAEENGDDPFQYINNLREYRGLGSYPLSNPDELMDEIEKEYKKEMYTEGELFYFFKRLNYSTYTGNNGKTISDFNLKNVFPIPDDEYVFGNMN